MQDLNDLFYFAEVVSQGGFAAAGRALNLPKSKLSRRVAQLEARLGVRLIERSSRRFQVTEIGRSFYAHCREALTEVARAEAAVAEIRAEPSGPIRFSCPIGLMEIISGLLPAFLTRFPKVRLQIVATNRRIDLIEERIDVALRVRLKLDTDATLTMRSLAKSRRILVASPAFIHGVSGGDPAALADISALAHLPTLTTVDTPAPANWDLIGPDGREISLNHEPRLACGDLIALRTAAVAGLGIALLPDHICLPHLQAGNLQGVFPGWHAQDGIVHLVFTTSRGLTPAVRAWIDHLAEHFGTEMQAGDAGTLTARPASPIN